MSQRIDALTNFKTRTTPDVLDFGGRKGLMPVAGSANLRYFSISKNNLRSIRIMILSFKTNLRISIVPESHVS